MNVFVSFLKFIIILLALAVCVGLVLIGSMVIFPSFSLFGLHYVSGDTRTVGYYYDLTGSMEGSENNLTQWNEVDKVLIQTENWDVSVRAATEDDTLRTDNSIDTIVRRNYRGFATNEVSTAELSGYTFEQRADGYYMIVSMTEPTGLISRTNTSVRMMLDSNLLADKDLIIETNGGSVTIGNTPSDDSVTTNIGSLTINSQNGYVELNDITVADSIIINKESGNLDVNKDLSCDMSLSISSGFGRADFNNVGSASNPNDLIINGLCNSTINFNTVYGNLMIEGNGGYVIGTDVEGVLYVDAETCDVRVNEVNGMISFSNNDGSLTVEDANDSVVANISGNGSIDIENLIGKSILTTGSGNIAVNNVNADISVKSNSGRIELTNAQNRQINYIIETTDSEVILNDINGAVNFNVVNKGQARVNVIYQELKGENTFVTHSGAVEITFKKPNYAFLLKDWQTSNSVSFKLSNFEEYSVNNSADNETYKSGVNIGGYTGQSDALSISSVSGNISVEQQLNN